MGAGEGHGGDAPSFLSSLQRFDAFPKVNEDFFQRTLSGGVITVAATVVMVLLFFSELRVYLAVRTEYGLTVDTSRGEKLQINLDVTFPHLPCGVVSLDAMDVSGEQHLDVAHNIFKRRLDETGSPVATGEKEQTLGAKVMPAARQKDGSVHDPATTNETYCGSCYGSEETPEQCCNTCDEVRESYRMKGWAFSNAEGIEQCAREGFSDNIKNQEGEGCNIYGYLEVNKVAGNFHFAPGKSFQHGNMHVHDLMPFHTNSFNMSHVVAKLSFGADFPGVVNPLDGVARDMDGEAGMYQYFLKVVPTTYQQIHGHAMATNQFSVTDHFKQVDAQAGENLPGVFFFYDLSPIKVELRERRHSVLHFVTSVCAIVGGLFTVSGIVDATVYHSHKAIKKKIELGKFT